MMLKKNLPLEKCKEKNLINNTPTLNPKLKKQGINFKILNFNS